jgi:hypothetical protein
MPHDVTTARDSRSTTLTTTDIRVESNATAQDTLTISVTDAVDIRVFGILLIVPETAKVLVDSI